MKDEKAIEVAIKNGATHLGFIFYEKSPRYITPKQAKQFANIKCNRVAVCVDSTDEMLQEIIANLNPNMLQLHGLESIGRIEEIKQKFNLPIIKVVAIAGKQDLQMLENYERCNFIDYLLLDTKTEGFGGSGRAFDWSLVENLQSKKPLILAGGIGINNVARALDLVHSGANSFCAIDVSSSLERKIGEKDIKLIEEFLLKVKNATS